MKVSDDAQLVLSEIDCLVRQKKYHEALVKLNEAQMKHAELAKMIPSRRGDIIMAMRECNAKCVESDPAIQALHELDRLMAEGRYEEAKIKLKQANKEFPQLTKATIPFYNGNIEEALYSKRKAESLNKSEGSKNNKCSPELK
ncbi:MAG: hypothetical protein K0S29_916 [Gammaproteobacteria bacterium]|nr:hypothetical protein [Gammaproteobacteria bacterium]